MSAPWTKLTADINAYMKDRRKALLLQGICVDCQKNKVDHDYHCRPNCRRNHACCSVCREARRTRLAANKRQYALPLPSVVSQSLSTERGKSTAASREPGVLA